jgi:hypothetical protein
MRFIVSPLAWQIPSFWYRNSQFLNEFNPTEVVDYKMERVGNRRLHGIDFPEFPVFYPINGNLKGADRFASDCVVSQSLST